MARIVTYVKLHQACFSPAFANIGLTLPGNKTYAGFKMSRLDNGDLQIEADGGKCAVIPYSNIVIMEMAPEVAKESKVK